MARELRSDLHVQLTDGTLVGYAESGDPSGPPVLYLHGRTSSRLELGLPGIREVAGSSGMRVIAPDRPGMGMSPFQRLSLADYPRLIGVFADALELDRFALIGVSGGGKYACACAWALPDRVSRLTLVSSTCSFDLPGARATWNAEDRRTYPAAARAPWLVRLYLARLGRAVRRDPDVLVSRLGQTVGPSDREVLADPAFREALQRDFAEAFRQGGRGPAQDFMLEARPWGIPLAAIRVPTEIWHGEDDLIVSPEQGHILARHLALAREHRVPRAGHFSLFAHHANAIMQSAVELRADAKSSH